MANPWDCDYIDIADDEADEDYDENNQKPVIISRAIGGYQQFQQYDDSSMEDSRRNQLYWTTDATKALIRLRGEREAEFEQGGARKSLLWVDICKKMRALGYDFSAEKVSKKWHNIMITYNKNISKKRQSGIVNWEFFEDIDVIYKYKREQAVDDEIYNFDEQIPAPKRKLSNEGTYFKMEKLNESTNASSSMLNDTDEPEHDFKKLRFNMENLESEIETEDSDQSWWKDYFEKKLELEREKMKKEQERHKDNMNFQKMALMLQEKVEKIKVDAINSLTSAITKLAEVKNKKSN